MSPLIMCQYSSVLTSIEETSDRYGAPKEGFRAQSLDRGRGLSCRIPVDAMYQYRSVLTITAVTVVGSESSG